MTINHDTVLLKVADYLKSKEGVFYGIRDIFDIVPFDKEDHATLRGLCFTLGNIVTGKIRKDEYYEGLENLYKMVLYSSDSNTKSYISFQRDSKLKERSFLAFLKEEKGDIYDMKKFKLYENGETVEKEIGVFKHHFKR